jgi:hypothetical protein
VPGLAGIFDVHPEYMGKRVFGVDHHRTWNRCHYNTSV